mgnify:CR=1 FL=1
MRLLPNKLWVKNEQFCTRFKTLRAPSVLTVIVLLISYPCYAQIPSNSDLERLLAKTDSFMLEADYDGALKSAEEIIQMPYQTRAVREAQTQALNFKVTSLFRLNNREEAFKLLDSTLVQTELWLGKNNILITQLLNLKGMMQNTVERPDKAISTFQDALDVYNLVEDKDSTLLIQLYINLAASQNRLSNSDSAIHYGYKALNLLEVKTKADSSFLASIYNTLGIAYGDLYGIKESQDFTIKALELRKLLFSEENLNLAPAYNNLAYNYFILGDYSKSEKYLLKSLEIRLNAQGKDHPMVYFTKANVAILLRNMSRNHRALAFFEQVLPYYTNNPSRTSIRVANNYANTSKDIGDYLLAEDAFIEALELIERLEVQNSILHAATLHNLGSLYLDMTRWEEAVRCLSQAFAIYQNFEGFNDRKAMVSKLLGRYFYRTNDFDSALHHIQLAMQTLSGHHTPFTVEENFDIDSIQNDLIGLDLINDKLEVLLNKFRNNWNSYSIDLFKSTSFTGLEIIQKTRKENFSLKDYKKKEKVEKELFDLIFTFITQNNNQDFDPIRLNETYMYSNLLNRLRQDYNWSKNIEAQKVEDDIAALRNQLKFVKAKLGQGSSGSENYRAEVIRIGHLLDSTQQVLKSKYSIYYKFSYDPEVVGLDELKRSLRKDEVFMSFFEGQNHYHISLVSTTLDTLFSISRSDIDTLVKKFVQPFNTYQQRSSFDIASGFQLYQLLLGSLRLDDTQLRKLIITGDGKVDHLNLEMLPTDQLGEQLVIDKYEIRYEHSATVQREFIANNPGFTIASFASTYSQEDSGRLKTDQEAIEVYELLGSDGYLNLMSTKQDFLDNHANHSILHIASHTTLNEEKPFSSGFIFEPEGLGDSSNVLTISEIYGIKLNADLAVLSACNTGLSDFQNGFGITSIAHSFAYAGCPSVVMTLWEIPDDIAPVLMKNFYTNLKKGLTKSEALRQAKLTYLKDVKNPQLRHPFYWAGFVLVGDNSPLVLDAPVISYKLVLLMVIILFTIVIMIALRRKLFLKKV